MISLFLITALIISIGILGLALTFAASDADCDYDARSSAAEEIEKTGRTFKIERDDMESVIGLHGEVSND